MAVFRVERNKGYTVMSNHHLRNKELTLKAKGLLSQMLSLPEDWDYTLAGLSQINREKIDAIREAIKELERAGYIVGVLVNLEVSGGIDATVIGKDIAMQIAALNPRFWDKSQVSEDVLAEEKKILVAQMDNDEKMASKPLQVKEKIAAGKMNKFFEENCLLQQAFVKDGSVTVEQYMNSAAKALGGSVKFVDAVRFEKGEGIEKKVDDFAAEVAAAAGLAK